MLFVGDDWAEDHHDVELHGRDRPAAGQGAAARGRGGDRPAARDDRRAARRATPTSAEVVVGIETDRGPWVQALIAAGYPVYRGQPAAGGPYRERHRRVRGQERRRRRAHAGRHGPHRLATSCGRSPGTAPQAEAVKVVTRAHKTLIWERTRHAAAAARAARVLPRRAGGLRRPRPPPTPWNCSTKAPTRPSAAPADHRADQRGAQTRPPPRHRRRKAAAIQAALRAEHLGQPAVVTAAYAAAVRAQVAILTILNEQIKTLQGQVEAHFGRHPDAEIILSQPGLGPSSAPGCSPSSATTTTATPTPRPARTTPAPARSPARPARRRSSLARFVHNDRLIDALMAQAFSALHGLTRRPRLLRPAPRPRRRPQRRAAPTRQPARRHPARLPQTRTLYDEATAWSHHLIKTAA